MSLEGQSPSFFDRKRRGDIFVSNPDGFPDADAVLNGKSLRQQLIDSENRSLPVNLLVLPSDPPFFTIGVASTGNIAGVDATEGVASFDETGDAGRSRAEIVRSTDSCKPCRMKRRNQGGLVRRGRECGGACLLG